MSLATEARFSDVPPQGTGPLDTATVRSVFAMDLEQSLRAVVDYPKHLGRNINQLVRIFGVLQTVDGNDVTAEVRAIAPGSNCTRVGAGLPVQTWYLSRKDLAA